MRKRRTRPRLLFSRVVSIVADRDEVGPGREFRSYGDVSAWAASLGASDRAGRSDVTLTDVREGEQSWSADTYARFMSLTANGRRFKSYDDLADWLGTLTTDDVPPRIRVAYADGKVATWPIGNGPSLEAMPVLPLAW